MREAKRSELGVSDVSEVGAARRMSSACGEAERMVKRSVWRSEVSNESGNERRSKGRSRESGEVYDRI